MTGRDSFDDESEEHELERIVDEKTAEMLIGEALIRAVQPKQG